MSGRWPQSEVVGQLMVDNDDNSTKDNRGLDAQAVRAGAPVSELNPVTKFQVCEATGNDCNVKFIDLVIWKIWPPRLPYAHSKSKKKEEDVQRTRKSRLKTRESYRPLRAPSLFRPALAHGNFAQEDDASKS